MTLLLSLLVIFGEPDFPVVGVPELIRIDGATEARSVKELRELLVPGNTLVWRHGSVFPVDAWEELTKFLEKGGSMIYIGGEPFTLPVSGEPGKRRVGPRSLAMLKALRLNQCYQIGAGGARLKGVGQWSGVVPERELPDRMAVAILEPRLCDTKDFADEDGSPGSRDGVLRPLAHVFRADDVRFPIAAAAYAIEQHRGKWAGGRWVLWLASASPTEGELSALLAQARDPVIDFRVDPTFGCFHAGEQPSVVLRYQRPNAVEAVQYSVSLIVRTPSGATVELPAVSFKATDYASVPVSIGIDAKPGLYRVRATGAGLPAVETGFWVFDRELFESGGPLMLDNYGLRRGSAPEPVVGTTLMSSGVQRKFLFEPNAAAWDDSFAELELLHINLVRTGLWSAWRKVALDPGVVDESWLRNLEAFYLTARKHGIPVVFNLFAFLPESFGGENSYLDPRAIAGQRAFLGAVAGRFAGAKEIMWDLINEPSFSSAKHLWSCRPNGDDWEKRAFLRWLGKPEKDVEGPVKDAWAERARIRWRLAPKADVGLPAIEDFEDGALFGKRRPYRAADYVRFSQGAFTDWALQMRAAIREAGSNAPITVGQDEGGLFQRPSPLFHHAAVDFTSMHTWWLNDSLLWDGLASKVAGKPLLISETGVMQRELLSGEAIRAPDEFAKLLSRKIGYAFAAGAFGVVQWCYDVNPYMASDNEVAIGLRRVDGSYKPEHRVLREFADFVNRNAARFESPREPEVVVVVPTADAFTPRDSGTAAVRRAVEVLVRQMGVAVRIVPDERLASDLGTAKAIILPANRGICEDGWRALCGAMERGTVLICSGWFDCDEVGLPVTRRGQSWRALRQVEPLMTDDGRSVALRFSAAMCESWYAVNDRPQFMTVNAERTNFVQATVPVEWSIDDDGMRELYRVGLKRAGVAINELNGAGLFVREIAFRDANLVIAINESSRAELLKLGSGIADISVPDGECRMVFLDSARTRVLDVSRSDPPDTDRR